jgi:rubrerythrin
VSLDFSHDELGRATAEIAREHDRSLRPLADALERLFSTPEVSSRTRSDVVLGGLARRRFLRIGATAVAATAVLAACGDDDTPGAAETTSTTEKAAAAGDLTTLRTASSLELVAVATYDQAIKAGKLTTPTVLEAARSFMRQHKEHAALFQGLTKKLGGQPYTEANPAVTERLAPRAAGLKSEQDVLALALEVERAAAATYLAAVGTFENVSLNEAIMSVGGVESRHAAVLATVLGQPAAPAAFGSTAGAVAPGTGI